MLHALFGFGIVCLFCALIACLPGVQGGAAPLLALSFIMVYFTLAGVAQLLVPAFWLFTALVLGLFAFCLWQRRAGPIKNLLQPGFVLFFALGLLLLVYLGLRQPQLNAWDEWTSWATAVKLIKQNSSLYTTAQTGYFWPMTEPPGLALLAWFFQYLGEFAPWKIYWAYNLLFIACAGALLAALPFNQWRVAVPVALCALCATFFFTVPYATIAFTNTWLCAYADIPGGMLFGGTLALYFIARRQGAARQAALPLAALCVVKLNVLPVALVAAGIMAADSFVFTPYKGKKILARLGAPVFWFAPPLALYRLWAAHVGWAIAQNSAVASATNMPISTAVWRAVQELLGMQPPSQAFTKVSADLINVFFGNIAAADGSLQNVYKASMVGSAYATALLICGLFLLALLLQNGLRARLRIAMAGFLALGGFAAYHFMLLVFYAFFSHTRNEVGVLDYARYLPSYTLGWFLLGLCLLAQAAQGSVQAKALLGKAGLTAAALYMALCCVRFLRPGYTILQYPQNQFAAQHQRAAQAAQLLPLLVAGQRVFFVYQGNGGGEYFSWHYHLLPAVLDYSVTGGAPLQPGTAHRQMSLAQLSEYLQQHACQYILVQMLDDVFVETYGSLFEENLADFTGAPTLYQRQAGGRYRLVHAVST